MTTFSEAIRLEQGRLHNLAYHQARVDRTAGHFFGTCPSLSGLPNSIPEEVRQGLFKCRVVYGRDIGKVEYIPYVRRRIEKVGVIRDDAIDYSYKYPDRSRLNILLRDSGCDEIVIVRRGLVTDASAFNLVFESADGLFTPAGPLLAGTKRQELLERGLIAARRIEAQELGDYLNVRFINAMTDLKEAPKVATAALVRL